MVAVAVVRALDAVVVFVVRAVVAVVPFVCGDGGVS